MTLHNMERVHTISIDSLNIHIPLLIVSCSTQAGSYSGSSSSSSSSSDSDSSSDESLKFDDGLDDELVGDEEDRKKLAQMTEAEREQEMYNRYTIAACR